MSDVSERQGDNKVHQQILQEANSKVQEGRPMPEAVFKALVDGSIFLAKKKSDASKNSDVDVSVSEARACSGKQC